MINLWKKVVGFQFSLVNLLVWRHWQVEAAHCLQQLVHRFDHVAVDDWSLCEQFGAREPVQVDYSRRALTDLFFSPTYLTIYIGIYVLHR
jgi:hypothetical protein